MSRHLPRLFTCIAIGALASVVMTISAAEPEEESLLSAQPEVRVYPVADLPVWSLEKGADGKPAFDPSVLTALVESRINADTWSGKVSSIRPHEKTASLVVRTTDVNHKKVAELLHSFRKPDPREETETISQAYDHVRTEVLNTIFRAERQRNVSAENAIELIDAEIRRVDAIDLTEQQKSSLLKSLKRVRVKVTTGEYPENDEKEQ